MFSCVGLPSKLLRVAPSEKGTPACVVCGSLSFLIGSVELPAPIPPCEITIELDLAFVANGEAATGVGGGGGINEIARLEDSDPALGIEKGELLARTFARSPFGHSTLVPFNMPALLVSALTPLHW